MALQEIITGNALSTPFVPSVAVSDIKLSGAAADDMGSVELIVNYPDGSTQNLGKVYGVFLLGTPDAAITYTFQAIECSGDVHIYCGP